MPPPPQKKTLLQIMYFIVECNIFFVQNTESESILILYNLIRPMCKEILFRELTACVKSKTI
jgi:hypothetical protein